MNESQWWSSHVKPRWHEPGKGRVAWKVQDAFNGGLPDVDVCFHGTVAKIELKFEPVQPKRETTPLWFSEIDKVLKHKGIVSAKQWNHLEQWCQAGGTSLILIGVVKSWFLLEQGFYDNRPMTFGELHAAAVLSYVPNPGQTATYESLADIPRFIMEKYGH